MKRYVPFLSWIGDYHKEWLMGDLIAGLTVGVMLIPQGMAYAMLAGLPPIYGLYASTIPLIVYAIFGTSRQLAVGPVAMVALLISSGVGAIAELGSAEFISLAILLALMVGFIQFSMGVMRLGFLVNFLSHPVIAGFTSAAALIIGFSQLKHLLGFDIPRGMVHETIINVVENIGQLNMPTFLVGATAILMLLLIKRVNRKIPGPLIAVLFGIAVVILFGLADQGVRIVRDVPGGLDLFALPIVGLDKMSALLPVAFTIAFIGFMESIAVAKAIQAKHKDYEVSANQELIGLGLANIIGSFFKAFPVTGGFSRTAVNDQAGAKTGMASIISAALIILTLLYLTDYFYYLPKAILAAIIMVAVFGLIDIKEAKHLWKTDRKDFWLFMITAIGTLSLGIEEGILIGVALSIGMLVYQVSYPHVAELGRVPGTDQFRNVERFTDLDLFDHTLLVRVDAQLFFANADFVKSYVKRALSERKGLTHVILDARAIDNMDSTAVQMMKDLNDELNTDGKDLHLAEVKGPVRDILMKNHLVEHIGEERFHLRVQDALNYIDSGVKQHTESYTLQATSE